jgi:hypothetical protein
MIFKHSVTTALYLFFVLIPAFGQQRKIKPAEVPATEVKNAVKAKYPTAVLRKAEKISTNDDIQYEVELLKRPGKRYY